MLWDTDLLFLFLLYTSYVRIKCFQKDLRNSIKQKPLQTLGKAFLLLLERPVLGLSQMSVVFNSLVRLPERQWAWRYLTQVQNFSDQKLFKVLLVYLPEPEVALGFCSCSPVMRQRWCFLYSWPSPDKWKSLHFGKLKRVLKYFSPYLWIWVACEYIWERHFRLLFQKMGGGG